jgi:hypothetical protein
VLPVLAVVHCDDDSRIVSKFLNALSTPTAGRAGCDVAGAANNRDAVNTFTALHYHGRNSGSLRAIAQWISRILNITANVQVPLIIDDRCTNAVAGIMAIGAFARFFCGVDEILVSYGHGLVRIARVARIAHRIVRVGGPLKFFVSNGLSGSWIFARRQSLHRNALINRTHTDT